MKTTIALLGIGLVATVVVMGAAVLVLKYDVGQLQRQHSAQNSGTSQTINCAGLAHIRLRLKGRAVHCTNRGN